MEDTDHTIGGANIFNGQESMLWNNVRDAYDAEITRMYQTIRANGIISYNTVEQRYEEHQSKWSEAIWIEDAWFKYIDPLINPDAGKEPTAVYLPMMQGSKAEQRKWWLINRFKYMDSKWNAGEALSQVIQLRGYAKANITVTPYADIYPSVRYASYLVKERGEHGKPTTLVCPIDELNDTEIYIYSAPQLASVGDLSPLKVGFADFSMATRLQSVKIGDASASYSNTNLYGLSLGSNVLLKTIDVRNCSGLGDTSMEGHTQTTVDISGCEIVEEVYFDGTKITGLTLPNGGVLRKLHLPETISNLTILNQKNITEFVMPSYANITTLRLENVSNAIDEETILHTIPANSRVRLIGIAWECADATEIDELLDLLDTMRGLDEQGGNVDKAQVSGTIHTSELTGSQIVEFNARYPYITFTADTITAIITYKTFDGASVIDTETVLNGGDGTKVNSTSRADSADGHYSYTPNGWSLEMDGESDPDALKNVTADRTVYASYTATEKSYTVTWMNGSTTIRTDSNVLWGTKVTWGQAMPTNSDGQTAIGWNYDLDTPITGDTTISAKYKPMYTHTFVRASVDGGGTLYTVRVEEGGTVTYGGATPTSTQGSATDYPFEGWNPTPSTSTADTTYTAKFGSPVEVAEITDSWDTIIANIDNGTYASKYKIGNYKPLDLGTEGTINMQIVAMDADELASGGYAPLTFIGMKLLKNPQKMNSTSTSVGGWESSALRGYLSDTILPLIPVSVRSRINRVNKTYYTYDTKSTLTSVDKLWIPSAREMFGVNDVYESNGIIYQYVYKNDESRRKDGATGSYFNHYWLRSALHNYPERFRAVVGEGTIDYYMAAVAELGVCLGFCLGLESETITDSWETILANENPSASYSIGDTKMIDLGTEGKHLMEIVAFDTDDKADGSGKAKITWISKDCLKTTHNMNDTNTTVGGWQASGMRVYLKNTIKSLIPADVRNAIVEVSKISSTYENGAIVKNGQTTTDDVWIPSMREVDSTSTGNETTGATYNSKFNSNNESRIKKVGEHAGIWGLRSADGSHDFRVVYHAGNPYNSKRADSIRGIALGFCTD